MLICKVVSFLQCILANVTPRNKACTSHLQGDNLEVIGLVVHLNLLPMMGNMILEYINQRTQHKKKYSITVSNGINNIIFRLLFYDNFRMLNKNYWTDSS